MKIAVIGSAPSSVGLAPIQDRKFDQWLGGKPPPAQPPSMHIGEDWQIWGCSPGAWAVLPRADVWFEVHRWEPGKAWFSPEYTKFLCEFRGRVFTGGVIPPIVNHVVYPIERVEEQFSAYFLHSSLSLMMAMAILEIEDHRKVRAERQAAVRAKMDDGHPLHLLSAEEQAFHRESDEDDVIGIWGVDMSATEEYGDQREGCQFFILEILRRGIKFYCPPESCLLRPKPIYGLSEWNHDYIKSTQRARELNQRRQHYEAVMADAKHQVDCLSGAQDNMQYYIQTWTNAYGLPAGVFLSQKPGTGLGGGITLPRPMTHHDTGDAGFVPVGSMVAVEQAPAPSPQPLGAADLVEAVKRKAKAKRRK